MQHEVGAVIVNGMTGVGKSKLAQVLANRLNGELICGDSVQLHKGLDILTNKPQLRAGENKVHLVGIQDPLEPLDSNRYARLARETILDIQARGKLPIIEGGSFYYSKYIFDSIRKADDEDDKLYRQSKELAHTIALKDGLVYKKTYARMLELAKQVEVPAEVI